MNSALKGAILVVIGASSYGMLTTFVKLAYQEGYKTTEVTFAQISLGCLGLFLAHFVYSIIKPEAEKASKKSVPKLIGAGTTLGLTSIFYYLSVQSISVSIGIVLLMQSVWLGVLLEAIITKTFPSKLKVIATVIIIIGTLLATNVIHQNNDIDPVGLMWGLLAAISFTLTIFATNRLGLDLPALLRSKWMMLGALVIATIFALPTFIAGFNPGIFIIWGPILALFGTIIPPLMFNAGMPKINLGLGSIIASLELPVAIMMAYFLLGEVINSTQWVGVILILSAVVLMNIKKIIRR